MIRQIEEKVVNRLRQVTSAIKQDGANQVSIITSTAERAGGGRVRARRRRCAPRSSARRSQKICADPEVAEALFEVLETQRLQEGNASLTLLPAGGAALGGLLASSGAAVAPGGTSGGT